MTILELAKIAKAYCPAAVLKGIDVTVARGEVLALVGECGAGPV